MDLFDISMKYRDTILFPSPTPHVITYITQIQVRNSSDTEISHKLAGATFVTSTVES